MSVAKTNQFPVLNSLVSFEACSTQMNVLNVSPLGLILNERALKE
jgi:hypothetical protein